MTVRSRPVRTRWVKQPAPKPAPEDPRVARAKNLPRFGPGIVITVPLHLLVEYMELYRLTPAGIREPRGTPKDGPGEAILLVRRTPKETNDQSDGNNTLDAKIRQNQSGY